MAKKKADTISKKWLRSELTSAVKFWAGVLNLSSRVDTIYIEMDDDFSEEEDYAACVEVDGTTRTATITVSRNIVESYEDRYDEVSDPSDIVSLIMLHECLHVVCHPMSYWASTVIDGQYSENKMLANLFEQEEEEVVEDLTKAWFFQRDNLEPRKYRGKIKYTVKKSPTEKQQQQPVTTKKSNARRRRR